MADERTHVTFLDLARWLLPVAVVVLGLVLFLMYHAAAPALGLGAGQ
ncbi:MAG TPA: hypothetical protein VFI39_05070 [Gemmatimonadales bacterium]|nr:hypothetical protein [Gemmatimonadales bacterium]